MNIKELKESDKLIFEYVRGSHMYGTQTEKSDIDIGGLFVADNNEWLSLFNPSQEIQDEKGDTSYFEIRKYFNLACTANPTVLETMFCPKDCIKIWNPKMDLLYQNRAMFVTRKCYWSFSGYSFAQIKKAKGQNKKIHNVEKMVNNKGIEILKEALKSGEITKEWVETRFNVSFFDFVAKGVDIPVCGDTDWNKMNKLLDIAEINVMMKPKRADYFYISSGKTEMPFRPVKLDCLEGYDVSAVEHMSGLYRLYRGGDGIKFMNDEIVCTSIDKDREWKDFAGVAYFNYDGYKKECKEWESFFEWASKRNEARWSTDWKKDMEFDCKNMCHTMRLMFEAEHILKEGFPKVRWDGEKLQFLRDVRAGKYEYAVLLKQAEDKMAELKEEYNKSKLPDQVNMKKANQLYQEMIGL